MKDVFFFFLIQLEHTFKYPHLVVFEKVKIGNKLFFTVFRKTNKTIENKQSVFFVFLNKKIFIYYWKALLMDLNQLEKIAIGMQYLPSSFQDEVRTAVVKKQCLHHGAQALRSIWESFIKKKTRSQRR
jgi:hypothetical protein